MSQPVTLTFDRKINRSRQTGKDLYHNQINMDLSGSGAFMYLCQQAYKIITTLGPPKRYGQHG